MPESVQHTELVAEIVRWIKERHDNGGLMLLIDGNASPSPYRPARVDGFCPDVEARIIPGTCTILGEAKSYADVLNAHTARQLRAYLEYLNSQPNPTLVVGVPLAALGSARSLVRRIQKDSSTQAVNVVFLYR